MKKKLLILICIVAAGLSMVSACGTRQDVVPDSASTSSADSGVLPIYALVTKSEGNQFNELMAEGFTSAIEESGGNGLVRYPSEATAEAQVQIIDELIDSGVVSIAVAANDANALGDVLQEAMEKGIAVSTVDSDVSADDRQVFVNQVSTTELAQALVEAVYDISGGEGQWAILSATSQATNQNAWINAMRSVLEDEKYQGLRLVDIVYGNDDADTSADLTEGLLEDYPDLKVICAPTTAGITGVAEVLESADSSVLVTGLGLPSEMAEYLDGVCPYFFLWNPIELGEVSAYVSVSLVNGGLTGAVDEVFLAGDLGLLDVSLNDSGATEIIVSEPIRFDSSNIDEWKDLF